MLHSSRDEILKKNSFINIHTYIYLYYYKWYNMVKMVENPFAKPEQEVPKKEDAPIQVGGRNVREINEDTITESNWVGIPNSNQVGESTVVLKLERFFQQEGQWAKNSETREDFWTGMSRTDKVTKQTEYLDEFVVAGHLEDGTEAQFRLPNWEMIYKMMKFIKYCKENNLTSKNQTLYFKRVGSGQKTAGANWELTSPTLSITISGKDNIVNKAG